MTSKATVSRERLNQKLLLCTHWDTDIIRIRSNAMNFQIMTSPTPTCLTTQHAHVSLLGHYLSRTFAKVTWNSTPSSNWELSPQHLSALTRHLSTQYLFIHSLLNVWSKILVRMLLILKLHRLARLLYRHQRQYTV